MRGNMFGSWGMGSNRRQKWRIYFATSSARSIWHTRNFKRLKQDRVVLFQWSRFFSVMAIVGASTWTYRCMTKDIKINCNCEKSEKAEVLCTKLIKMNVKRQRKIWVNIPNIRRSLQIRRYHYWKLNTNIEGL